MKSSILSLFDVSLPFDVGLKKTCLSRILIVIKYWKKN